MTVKLSRLIEYLNHIQAIYGDMEVGGNVLGGDLMEFTSLCVVDNIDCIVEDEPRYNLLLELDESDVKWKSVFRVYEYPTNNDINL